MMLFKDMILFKRNENKKCAPYSLNSDSYTILI